jgi:hypothetical protein
MFTDIQGLNNLGGKGLVLCSGTPCFQALKRQSPFIAIGKSSAPRCRSDVTSPPKQQCDKAVHLEVEP